MLIRKVTQDQLSNALRNVNMLAGTSMEFRSLEPANKSLTAWRVTLRLASSRDHYHRRSQNGRCRCRSLRCGHTFRMPYVCWHGHRDWMRCLYQLNPDAIIISGSIHRGGIRYDGVHAFESLHEETGERNIGSQMYPLAFADACDCSEDLTSPVVPVDEALRVSARLDRAERERANIQHRIARAETRPLVEDYGASEADGAACRAMANALRAIQRERKEGVTA